MCAQGTVTVSPLSMTLTMFRPAPTDAAQMQTRSVGSPPCDHPYRLSAIDYSSSDPNQHAAMPPQGSETKAPASDASAAAILMSCSGAGHGPTRPHESGPPAASTLAAPLSATNLSTSAPAAAHGSANSAPASLPNRSTYSNLYPPGHASQLLPTCPAASAQSYRLSPLPVHTDRATLPCASPIGRSMRSTQSDNMMLVQTGGDPPAGDAGMAALAEHMRHISEPLGALGLQQGSGRGLSGNVSASMAGAAEGGDGSRGNEESAQSRSAYADDPSGPRSQGKRKREVSRWTPPEEAELRKAVSAMGTSDWARVADAVRTRSARQCKEHYREVLSPDVKHGEWSVEEELKLVQAHARMGQAWSRIAPFLPGRPANACKNKFNGTLRRKDNEESILAVYIGQLCKAGRLCTDEVTRSHALQHALRMHEARRAEGAFNPSGHSSSLMSAAATSLTHLAAAGGPHATAYHAVHAAPALPLVSLIRDPVTTGATGGREGGVGGATPSRPTTAACMSEVPGLSEAAGGSQSALSLAQGVLEPCKSPPLTLDGVLGVNGVSLDLQQQLEGLLKAQCRQSPGAEAPPAAGDPSLALQGSTELAAHQRDAGLGWSGVQAPKQPEPPQHAAGGMHVNGVAAQRASSMHDLLALEQHGAVSSTATHAMPSGPQQAGSQHQASYPTAQRSTPSAAQHASAFPYAYIANPHAPVCLSPPLNKGQHSDKHVSHAYKMEDVHAAHGWNAPSPGMWLPQRPYTPHVRRADSEPPDMHMLRSHSGQALMSDAAPLAPQSQRLFHQHAALPFAAHLSAAEQQNLLHMPQHTAHSSDLTARSGAIGGSDAHTTAAADSSRLRPWSISAPQLPCGVAPPDGSAAAAAAVAKPHGGDSHAGLLPLHLLLQSPPHGGPSGPQLPWQPPPRALTPPPGLDACTAPAMATHACSHPSAMPYAFVGAHPTGQLVADVGMHVIPVATSVTPHGPPGTARSFPPQLQVPPAAAPALTSATTSMHDAGASMTRSPSYTSIPVGAITASHPAAADPASLHACLPYTVSTGAVRLPSPQLPAASHQQGQPSHAATMAPAAIAPVPVMAPLQPQHAKYHTAAAASGLRTPPHSMPSMPTIPSMSSVASAHSMQPQGSIGCGLSAHYQGSIGWGMPTSTAQQVTSGHHEVMQQPEAMQYPAAVPQTLHVMPQPPVTSSPDGIKPMHDQHASWAPMQGVVQCPQGPSSHQRPPYRYSLAPLGYDPSMFQGLFGAMSPLPAAVISASRLDGTNPPGTHTTGVQPRTPQHAASTPQHAASMPQHTASVTAAPSAPQLQPGAPSSWGVSQATPQAAQQPPVDTRAAAAADTMSGSMLGVLAAGTNVDLLQQQQLQ
eukprot:jgi/Ulvmu1/11687/UM008_0097.1